MGNFNCEAIMNFNLMIAIPIIIMGITIIAILLIDWQEHSKRIKRHNSLKEQLAITAIEERKRKIWAESCFE